MSRLSLIGHMLLERFFPGDDERVPEPELVMASREQASSFLAAGREDGVIAPTYLFHTLQLIRLIRPGWLVLDLACGPANQLAQVARIRSDAQFLGVDASGSMLDLARRTAEDAGLDNVRFEEAYVQALDMIGDASVDMVMSTMSLHHLPDYSSLEATFEEARRVLKPGGGLYLADFGRLSRDSTRQFFAHTHAEQQSALFTVDYLNSLRAAFSTREFEEAMKVLGHDVRLLKTGIIPFMVVICRGEEREPGKEMMKRCAKIYESMSGEQRQDFDDLVRFFRMGGATVPRPSFS